MTVDVRWTGPLDALGDDDRAALFSRATTLPPDVREAVAAMLADVEIRGDAALRDLTERFDKVQPESLLVAPERLEGAVRSVPSSFLEDIATAATQIRAYHETMGQHRNTRFNGRGVSAYERVVPLHTVGVYVPGGRAAYPSTVAMTVVPAQVAGVRRIIVASPPGPDGLPNPLVLAACHALGVTDVVAVGGAQAVFALALGTESVPRCDAVVGPGNRYVQAAKELVAGRVRIDAPAGPSEVAVLVDARADAAVAAWEMAAQAEHDPSTLAVAVCIGEQTAERVLDALAGIVRETPRAAIVREALKRQGAVLSTTSLDEAVAFLDALAPEHCVLLHPEGPEIAKRLTGPACIVAGRDARVPLTDYVAGPSHVLPTGGTARAYAGLGLDTFTKRVHIVILDGVDRGLVEAAARLARLEGLEAHATAIEGCWR